MKPICKYIFILLLTTSIAMFLSSCSTINVKKTESTVVEKWQVSTPEKQGMDSGKLVELINEIKEKEYNIDSVTIIRNGNVVIDGYFFPFQKDYKHILHSCTKSITSALVGIAIDKGYIKSVDQPVIEFFPDKSFANLDENKRAMTLEHLLTMTSGLECRDSYLYRWVGLTEMRRSNDWVQHVLDLPMSEAPGEKFEYCNGVSYILSAIIQKTTKMKTLDFANQHLFGQLGITDVRWKTSPQGIDIGWGEMWLKPQDMAKFGLLYLNKGRWNGEQIIPAAWVEESTLKHIDSTLFNNYGYQWWIGSSEYYVAVGYGGQFIYVVPEKNMVVVFTSVSPGRDFYIPNVLLNRYIIPAAVSSEPLPENPEKSAMLTSRLKKNANPNPPDPVTSLPEIAMKTSGKTYKFDRNFLRLKTCTFTYQPESDEFQIEFSMGNEDFSGPVGLDNVYRITTSSSGNIYAWKAAWGSSDVLIISYQHIGFTNRGIITARLEGNKATMTVKNIMYPSTFTITGYSDSE
jgi:CubicO group peptidase (beta-lactamase class C family)